MAIQPPQVLKDLGTLLTKCSWRFLPCLAVNAAALLSISSDVALVFLQVPSVDDLTSGRARIDALRPIAIEDLLGREVPADPRIPGPGIRNAVVFVTVLVVRLALRFAARFVLRLILLIAVNRRFMPSSRNSVCCCLRVDLQPVLGSATDPQLLQRLFVDQAVELVFHAAAYKHVPLVEINPLAGLANNVGSTRQVCVAATVAGVHQVVLISTDKAVRPTNVMGASKRLAELVVQAHAAEVSSTRFSMVRFGNVLGSSGSVVPLFRRQIAAGGPITLTHRRSSVTS